VISNMAPVVREGFRLGMPSEGRWRELLNTDAADYGGSGAGNGGRVVARGEGLHGLPASATLTLPPLATLFLAPED
jgi:1,4-alpha-glucan branching enzyme